MTTRNLTNISFGDQTLTWIPIHEEHPYTILPFTSFCMNYIKTHNNI